MSDVSILVDGLNLTEAQITQLTNNLATLKSSKLLELDSDVARAKEGSKLTRAGKDLLAKAVAGKQLHYTRAALGDSIKNGKIIEPTDAQAFEYTKLIHERNINLPLTDVRFTGGGTACVTFLIDNQNLTEGFWAREIGLFARDPDSGQEILYSYKNTGVLASYIIGGGGAVAITLSINLITVVDQATNVTAAVDATLISVSQADFLAHVNSTHPHPNVPNKSTALTSSDYFWAAGSDDQLHPISKDNLTVQILGDNIYELPHLANRISQTEINIANLFSQITPADLPLEANLLLAEDFSDNRFSDFLAIKVDDEVAGANNVCVSDARGILEGHKYVISDSVRSQYVQVKSVAKNDSLYVIFFEENLAYTFDLTKTWIYRSTASLVNGKLAGSGAIRETLFTFDTIWKGASSATEQTLDLVTTLKKKKNFTLSGNYGFTSNGEFTIA